MGGEEVGEKDEHAPSLVAFGDRLQGAAEVGRELPTGSRSSARSRRRRCPGRLRAGRWLVIWLIEGGEADGIALLRIRNQARVAARVAA